MLGSIVPQINSLGFNVSGFLSVSGSERPLVTQADAATAAGFGVWGSGPEP